MSELVLVTALEPVNKVCSRAASPAPGCFPLPPIWVRPLPATSCATHHSGEVEHHEEYDEGRQRILVA
jgi:hypothetical protein